MALPDKRGLDHIVHCVHDLDAAIATVTALGFTTTPRAEHPWGTANSLIQFDGSFIELLEVADASKLGSTVGEGQFDFGAFCQHFLDPAAGPGEGMAMLVFEGADARAEQAEFASAGLDTYAPFDFQRQAELPGGETATVGFSLAFVTHPDMHDAAFFTCQQHAPEHFWKPDYQQHANGAAGLRNVLMAAENPGAYRDFFSRLQHPDRVNADDDLLVVYTNRGQVSVLQPDDLALAWDGISIPDLSAGPRFAAIEIAVPGLERPYMETVHGLAYCFVAA